MRVPLVFLIVVFTSMACAAENPGSLSAGHTEDGDRLLDLPEQDLSALEPAVAEQLKHSRELVHKLMIKDSHSQDLADALGELGKLYQAYELNQGAETAYYNARRLDPNQFQWSYYLAHLYLDTGKPQQALELFLQIETVHPQPVLMHIHIGEAYQALNRLAEARQSYLQAFYLQPGSAAVLARLGELAVEEKQYHSAISFLNSALTRRPDANRLHYPLAMAYRGLGDTAQAVIHLRQRGSVGIQPDDPWIKDLQNIIQGERSYLLRGKLAYSAGRYAESIDAFRTALTYNKDSARAHINLGTALMQTGKKKEALEQYLEALSLEPDNMTIAYNLGFLYSSSGKYTDAIPYLEKVITNNPEDANAHQLLAQALEKNLRSDEAMEYYRKTVLLDPTAENAWLGGVRLLVQNGDYQKALGVLKQAYKSLPNNGLIVYALAKLLVASPDLSLRDGATALPLALSVFQANPSTGHARIVAMAYAESGQCKQAVEWQQRAIDAWESGDVVTKKSLKSELSHYKDNEPCRIEP